MKIPRTPARLFLAALFGFLAPRFLEAAAPKADSTYISKVAAGEQPAAGMAAKTGKTGWWARSWTKTDGAGFFGRPEILTTTENADDHLIIRYTRYATEYD